MRTVLISVFTAALSLSLVVIAAPPTSVAVRTIISDYDTGIGRSLQIQSDAAGAYVNSRTLESLMYSTGSWELDAYNVRNATRRVYLAFTQPIDGTGPNGGAPVAPATGLYLAHVTTECFRYNTYPLAMAPGTSASCPMALRFDAGGMKYAIHMNPQNPLWAGTNPVTMSCIFPSSGSGPCAQWRITPSSSVMNPDGSVTHRNAGQLDLVTSGRGGDTYARQGQFYFSFVILITNP